MICPGCFTTHHGDGYCKKCQKVLFDGKKVNPTLSFNPPQKDDTGTYTELTSKLSISGVQIKYSMKLEKNKLVFTESNGHYILKPVPVGQFKNLDQVPANEHLTMQIAKQFFKITIPANAIVFFNDGSPAYLVRRFDVKPDGSKLQQEDFAQIAQVTEQTHGKNYKYDLSYEEIGILIRQFISMYPVEMEKFFRLVLFNYVFCNGDAHVKNFSALKLDAGDYVLTPAYDLLCTKLHSPQEHDMALDLFSHQRFSETYHAVGFYTRPDFIEFGNILEMKRTRVSKIIDEFTKDREEIHALIEKSFLRNDMKQQYHDFFSDRIRRMNL